MVSILRKTFIKVYIVLWFITGCKVSYRPYEFDNNPEIIAPDYTNEESWAVLPTNYPDFLKNLQINKEFKNADIFYIYPTLLTSKNNKYWYSDIWDADVRNDVYERPVKYQASAWLEAGNLYIPFYRQAHIRVFNKKYKEEGKKALKLAYSDVKRAFQFYLENYNKGKPFIIASHSQGTLHAREIIKEFIDGKPLQEKFISAYLIGIKVNEEDFKNIKLLRSPTDIGGFVSWNTYKYNKLPRKDNYEKWFKGGVATNPITWDDQKYADKNQHKGLLYKDLTIYPENVKIKVGDGIVWSTLPDIPGKFFLSFIRSYHFADINLFWKDISVNAKQRVNKWFEKNRE